ncbi:MAG TPA: molybdopterin molybdenumtransferase MoeA [Firmicutes bacterium]|nr:molybdopterin molybdenumtransferase MoeA [Bacillota bacterium]HAZ22048.1 molybdopterin molybdenumtransferase MoeA [Bacillota bacterium]HBE06308.1 molybdopterin molybdenumtransferase MoeA [Bacillota bacterium]HBG44931.1 molybdopterin molybdenumtransferase MoeA [Bacillota bacterium]HBL50749.1 molybdopterin molybdenumtransferase MoeA [Bacillota bacterium]
MTPAAEALNIWLSSVMRIGVHEDLPLQEAYGRVLASDLRATADLPGFRRSTVDGYAVRAKDTFGAGEGLPAILNLVGAVRIGQPAALTLLPGQTAWVPTGAMIPEGADAVVMLEYTETLADLVQISRPAAPGDNVILADEDAACGDLLLPAGQRIGSGEIGLLASLGCTTVRVVRKPRACILSTGDEIVPIDVAPAPGQVRDINLHTITALIKKAGGCVTSAQLRHDDADLLTASLEQAIPVCDLIVLSGGSSVGDRDYTINAINRVGKPGVLIHGIAVKPGKPTVLGNINGIPVIGLPGHPVSAMIAWRLFGDALVAALLGTSPPRRATIRARLSANLSSAPGREDFYRVRLHNIDAGDVLPLAVPVLGKSGLITTMARIDGIIRIPLDSEGFQKGEIVEVEQFD